MNEPLLCARGLGGSPGLGLTPCTPHVSSSLPGVGLGAGTWVNMGPEGGEIRTATIWQNGRVWWRLLAAHCPPTLP